MIATLPTDFIMLTVSLSRLWHLVIGKSTKNESSKQSQKLLRPEAENGARAKKLLRPEAENRKFWQDWLGGMRGIGRACSARTNNRQKLLRPEAEKWRPHHKLLRLEAENRKFR